MAFFFNFVLFFVGHQLILVVECALNHHFFIVLYTVISFRWVAERFASTARSGECSGGPILSQEAPWRRKTANKRGRSL